MLRDVSANVPGGAKLLVLDNLPYAYLLGEYTPCSPAPWINDVGDEQLRLFYKRNPRLIPEYVLVARQETGVFNRADTSAESLPEGYVKDLLLQAGTVRTETASGTFYRIL